MLWRNGKKMTKQKKYKIALLSSGLGHIKRGIETWTDDLGRELHKRDLDVTVYKGGGSANTAYEKVVLCIQRMSGFSRSIIKNRPQFLWRLGFGSGYTLEEMTYGWMILPELIIKQYDIIHTQDPEIADFLRVAKNLCLIRSKIILAHGTEESFKFLDNFEYVQHLAPFHKEEMLEHKEKNGNHFAIGNFVDIQLFHPSNKPDLRGELNIPKDAFVVLSVAAIKKVHKRIDYLIKEMAKISNKKVYLVVAGSRGNQSDELIKMGEELLGHRGVFLSDFPHNRIHEVYAMADIFALCSLKDMMPIALLEAISSGLPALVHQYPVEEWMINSGGEAIDMSKEGELSLCVDRFLDTQFREDKSIKARNHAVKNFSTEVILEQIIDMYEEIVRGSVNQ